MPSNDYMVTSSDCMHTYNDNNLTYNDRKFAPNDCKFTLGDTNFAPSLIKSFILLAFRDLDAFPPHLLSPE